MSDIVERLRRAHPQSDDGALRHEAAAEITRLATEMQEAREILAGTAVGSLPNDYPLSRLAIETWNTLQQRTTEGLALIGKIEALTARVKELEAALKDVDAECTAAIGYEPIPKGYTAHEDIPNGLRTISHIKLSMIRGYARSALSQSAQPAPSAWRPIEPKGPTSWPSPTTEMLTDTTFNAIWNVIKTWDINVPAEYSGYCGATGNHVRAILDALTQPTEKGGE
jgi:hypothetical protein